ncbi:sulfite exporter TauE/SafE family protein [Ancylomarina sp. 16SWW S1-10-2]|uniref:sulfite exporter TauE/SafE family protein n=1 Tax=Ancylomarina sp. 16SWW S1-10-2 TaxID=2499681 RepID=UPI0012AE74EE|nr:sulfite exporter TauE/SafE family protein [Ancylomarina sp. 16SWW S1-10-2]MRT93020.1 sulfite exporter TauE/SafE family protein [Ancylomarina sp. 16SWW S1-10-2]
MMFYFWIILIVSVASLVKGITGFGFALISLPPLLIWYSPKELIPVLILCNLFASLVIVLQKKDKKLVNKQFQSLIVYGAFFTVVGVLALKYISEDILITIMSIFFILLSVVSLIGIKYSIKLSDLSYKLAGMFLGFLTGSISISGPPLALFLNSANVDNQEFREIFSWFSIVTSLVALVGYAFLGLLTTTTFKMVLIFLPILYLGSFVGKRLNHRIPPLLFKNISLCITLLSSLFLLLK